MARAIDAVELRDTIVGGLTDLKTSMGQHEMIFNAVIGAVQNTIDRMPTIDTVKHGYWNVNHECSECGYWNRDFFAPTPNYCARCGARMDGNEK